MTEQVDSLARASLFHKIAAVAGAIETIDKDGKNKDKGYRYATPAGVMLAVKPLMNSHNLAIVPHLVETNVVDTGRASQGGASYLMTYIKVHYHILDGETGEEMVVPWEAQAGTYGDDKGIAKAQTIALRTFLIQLFQIPTEDPDTDPDARDARPVERAQPQRPPAREAMRSAPNHPPANGGASPEMRELMERLAKLRTEAGKAKIVYSPPKLPGAMSRLELEAAIGQLEQALGVPVDG